jgi:IclR family pca regulon transcriptional regulator
MYTDCARSGGVASHRAAEGSLPMGDIMSRHIVAEALEEADSFPLAEAPDGGISDRDFVNSFARGLEVIRVFCRHTPKMTLSEVAQATGMTRATVRRFLLTLVREGYAESDGAQFSLRPKILELGFSALSSMNVWDVAQPIMNALSDRLQESCFAAVLDGDSVIYVARASSNRLVNVGITIGSRVPAHCVSTGRVLLAALPEAALHAYLEAVRLTKFTPFTVTSKVKLRGLVEEARLQGWASVDQELEIGLRSLSVPIRDRDGATIAALNVCCPSARMTPEDMRTRVLTELLDATNRISRALKA